MTVYVDDMCDTHLGEFRRMKMSHMIADSTEELLEMADRIGVQRKWIQHPNTPDEHFDIAKGKRALAIQLGAVPVDMLELGRIILKRRKEQSMATKTDLPVLSIHRPTSPRSLSGYPRLKRKQAPRPTPERPLIISASELKTFLRCRLKWYWRHQVRIEPLKKPAPLVMGGVVHKILDPWYDLPDNKRTRKAIERIAKKLTNNIPPEDLSWDDVELIRAMTSGFATYARPLDKELGLKNIQTEQFFELPLAADGSILVRGYIDVVFKLSSLRRTVGCFEHKTAKSISKGQVDTNIQLSVYLWALRRLFPKARRYIAIRNYLRKQMPGPRVTAPLFDREPVERTDEEIEQWAEDMQNAALDMLDASIYPNPMDSCSWDCDFQVPCLLRGNAADMEHILNTSYQRKESRHGGTQNSEEAE